MRKSQAHEIDDEVQPKDQLHLADSGRLTEEQDEHAIQIFTDGSKSENGVGAGIAIFIQSELAHQLRYTLHNTWPNNQTEHLAIVKALEKIGKLHRKDDIPRTATVHRQRNHPSISSKYKNNHNFIIEEIRKTAVTLEKRNWTITFTWVKAHAGTYENELADKLAKEAAGKDDISFNRIPRNEIVQQVRDQSIAKWQNQWDRTTEGLTTKQFFPIIKDRLTSNIKLTSNFTAIVTAHGNTKT